MCAGLQATIERERWSAKSVLVWVDFSSIPQVCKSVQTLAINSLAACVLASARPPHPTPNPDLI